MIVTEKPSVMRTIAAALSGMTKARAKDGNEYWESRTSAAEPSIFIAAARGHLISVSAPTRGPLPWLPNEFHVSPLPDCEGRLSLIKSLAGQAPTLVNACDAGREGELIFRRIVEYLGLAHMHSERMWLQALTKKAICEAFSNRRSNASMLPLASAARRRQEADWIVGINGTSALRRGWMEKPLSVGRVMTPTLSFVVDREREIADFVPTPYLVIKGEFKVPSTGHMYSGKLNTLNLDDEADWESLLRSWGPGTAGKVLKDKLSDSKQKPPALFSLSDLQREMGATRNATPKETLGIAQQLYERAYISYPRTDSRHLPKEYEAVARDLLSAGASGAWTSDTDLTSELFGAAEANVASVGTRVFDDAKVSDHYAIIPTQEGIQALRKGLVNPPQGFCLQRIVQRFVAAFLEPAKYMKLERLTELQGYEFRQESMIMVEPGFKAVYGQAATPERIPTALKRGCVVELLEMPDRTEKMTQPKARYTEVSLLSDMENAGKKVDDVDVRSGLSSGIGTPATRAETIEKLLQIGFVEAIDASSAPANSRAKPKRAGKAAAKPGTHELRATPQAMELISCLRGSLEASELSSPEMTARWELMLRQIEEGDRASEKAFDASIRSFITRLVQNATKAKGPLMLKDMESLGSKRMVFGMHKGKPYEEVRSKSPGYCDWVLKQIGATGALFEFREYLLATSSDGRAEATKTQQGRSSLFPNLCRKLTMSGGQAATRKQTPRLKMTEMQNEAGILNMKYKELQAELKARGLQATGKTAELQGRLAEAIRATA